MKRISELRVGRLYTRYSDGEVIRIIRGGGAGFWSGRGSTPQTATPDNYIRATDVYPANADETNSFLENEMKNGMTAVMNAPIIYSRGDWKLDEGSQMLVCKKCKKWIHPNNEKRCYCDAPSE
jgi:hypothetical protein